ncbi:MULTISPECIES: UDP-N-acetylmuramoyl-tripeptide--D-alanyl-D-alanine ligase [Carnobacterium]|jgi:UDP-N-acetylmuramoyl-tripeptide--D-alanyl-D-alanine ligase|uniref:UDP-N-acetylmuramoyl-tripeptide--D-alanyl-D-alanine ligase n=1 Tax=Carnobacterium inhibens subsp. gilichinskyi TaxID=1266845 RepID=U5SA52_9LACT|nr:UDP-N-acetylmuramoyl-tripeptide--D-alanyl-D-alanine ligase [Carnobacterium inhibens]AGY80963.1 UDP-N-acetylmuramoyl-tripeptide--D-alanyl-D-alanine ligase [Carnobacterium inhibens subsp. gilichinskyi]MCM3513308.1 UDP-N-acetylmuramoyl-tripeptide--D-alanyl-D-alanine ligase [Carnobacterium inhibens]
MISLTIKEIAVAVGALNDTSKWSDEKITSVEFDTRKLVKGSLFVPLLGNNDGHEFILKAIENGAVVSLWSKSLAKLPIEVEDVFPVIQVKDTLQALQDLAKFYLAKIHPKVVGITGSNGKTTTKDMTDAVLSSQYRVHKTQGNFNNHIGLPITILEMPEDTEVIILEMGMNHAGEIKVLSELAEPDVAVITMIGESHIEFFGSRAGIADAKMEISLGLKENGVLIYPGEEILLQERVGNLADKQLKTFGTAETNDLYPLNINAQMNQTSFVTNDDPDLTIVLPVLGTYNVNNALAALSVGKVLGVPVEQSAPKLAQFQLTKNRTEWLDGVNGSSILNDAYNANPTAMKAVLDNFSTFETNGKRLAVLGEMLELGEQSSELHLSVKDSLNPSQIDKVILYGDQMSVLYEALKEKFDKENLFYFTGGKEPLIQFVKEQLEPGDYILLKSSLGTDLLSVVRALQA